jgi:hypothetical protein
MPRESAWKKPRTNRRCTIIVALLSLPVFGESWTREARPGGVALVLYHTGYYGKPGPKVIGRGSRDYQLIKYGNALRL